ncbi:phage baseplate assembly protein V [Anaeromicropila populeti]|uniref:Gp5/Type VI secretion system Vgr protein OB-fold domain-containing protein n=1 Tax=Anaeromicropila populeti TaxID=37658 RepID=A0A1I6LTM6_9FIRM|nr:phage baseplate assembly protein V [Anaeromicropila populeti]SFS06803.1 hypothetical protein SAMN05661086_03553 [Anaeromicropila populeti]
MALFGEFLERENESEDKIWSVTTGIVKENWNTDYPGKLKVEIFMGEQGKNVTGWIPFAAPYGGNSYGFYTMPEIGSEVVIAFNMGDRNCPIVIGCLWNTINALPPNTANEKNTIKRFLTKGGCEVILQDEEKKGKIEVHSPLKYGIVMDDENKKITVTDDKNENQIIIDAENGKVSVEAKKKIELIVDGNTMLSLDGSQKAAELKANKITIEAAQSLEIKGQSTKLEGTSVEVSSQGSLKVESSGMAQIKGSMLKLN